MGTGPVPFWANLDLYDYKSDFIFNLIKNFQPDKPRVIKFKNPFQFIDEDCNVNNFGMFSKSFHVTCPNELLLKSSQYGLHATFRDLDIIVLEGIY